MAPHSRRETDAPIQTAGEIFRDGTAIELLRDPARPEGFSLVCSRQGILDPKPVLSHGGRVYAPVRAERAVSKAVCFPTRVAQPESAEKIVHGRARPPSPPSRPARTVHHRDGLHDFCVLDVTCFADRTDSLDRRPRGKPKKSRAADAGCVVPSPPPLGRSEAR